MYYVEVSAAETTVVEACCSERLAWSRRSHDATNDTMTARPRRRVRTGRSLRHTMMLSAVSGRTSERANERPAAETRGAGRVGERRWEAVRLPATLF